MVRPARRPTSSAAAAGGVVLLAAAASWLVVRHLGAPAAQRLVDLDVYRGAGRAVLDGRDVYTFVAHPPQRLPFTYPPFAALLAAPLAVVPFLALGWVWTAGELASTVVICRLAFDRVLRRCGRWWPLALGAVAGAMTQLLPLRDEIKFGQVDELLVVLCALDVLVLTGRRGAGVLIGVATAVKLTPGVFIVHLLVTGRRRAAATAAAVFVGLTGVAAAVRPHDSWSFWSDALWHSERLRPNAGTSNQSLRGMWLRAVPGDRLGLALWLATAVLVALVGFRRVAAASRAGDETTAAALSGLLAVLLSPVAWIHHLCWLPLVIGAIVADGRHRRRVALSVAVWLFYVVPVPWIGSHLVHDAVPRVLARLLQDGFGLAALVLLLTLRPVRHEPTVTTLARSLTVGHNREGVGRGSVA